MKNPPKQVSILLHHECETPGLIADALQRAGVGQRYIRGFKGDSVPQEMGAAAGLVIMGGPQSVYEQANFPYLRDEMRLIEDALKHNKPILGVCLGSQLLAAALGANVYPGRRKEIGWHRVTLTDFAANDHLFRASRRESGGASVPACAASDPFVAGIPKSFTAFHWHGDIFDLPRGATPLASSALTTPQAFRYARNAYGLLFHLEATPPQILKMVETFSDELQSAGLNGSAIKLNAHAHLPVLQKIGQQVSARWVGLFL